MTLSIQFILISDRLTYVESLYIIKLKDTTLLLVIVMYMYIVFELVRYVLQQRH